MDTAFFLERRQKLMSSTVPQSLITSDDRQRFSFYIRSRSRNESSSRSRNESSSRSRNESSSRRCSRNESMIVALALALEAAVYLVALANALLAAIAIEREVGVVLDFTGLIIIISETAAATLLIVLPAVFFVAVRVLVLEAAALVV
ncbi:5873_t:CDS:2 [Diversispora eburnea]|uniref:5873_t:CDS:1 n=1 Tax=Diversispora eburnea TaxID=1213867 RepID=A0A9N8ZAE4_9GLOM|nr:5873_t:CDS:2 [Diversispora eburnea]